MTGTSWLHPLPRLQIQAASSSCFPLDQREPTHFQYHLLPTLFPHLTHFPLLSKDSAQFSSLLPHRSDPLLKPFPQRHDPVCLHPSPCNAITPTPNAHATAPTSLPPPGSSSHLFLLPVSPQKLELDQYSPRGHTTPDSIVQGRPSLTLAWPPLTQVCSQRAGPIPSFLEPCSHHGLARQVTAEMSRPLAMPVFPVTVRSPALRNAGNYSRTCYGQRKHAAAYAFNRDSIIRLFLKKSFCWLPIYQCLHFLNKNDL